MGFGIGEVHPLKWFTVRVCSAFANPHCLFMNTKKIQPHLTMSLNMRMGGDARRQRLGTATHEDRTETTDKKAEKKERREGEKYTSNIPRLPAQRAEAKRVLAPPATKTTSPLRCVQSENSKRSTLHNTARANAQTPRCSQTHQGRSKDALSGRPSAC